MVLLWLRSGGLGFQRGVLCEESREFGVGVYFVRYFCVFAGSAYIRSYSASRLLRPPASQGPQFDANGQIMATPSLSPEQAYAATTPLPGPTFFVPPMAGATPTPCVANVSLTRVQLGNTRTPPASRKTVSTVDRATEPAYLVYFFFSAVQVMSPIGVVTVPASVPSCLCVALKISWAL